MNSYTTNEPEPEPIPTVSFHREHYQDLGDSYNNQNSERDEQPESELKPIGILFVLINTIEKESEKLPRELRRTLLPLKHTLAQITVNNNKTDGQAIVWCLKKTIKVIKNFSEQPEPEVPTGKQVLVEEIEKSEAFIWNFVN
jgi:hypothetical protein